MPLGYVTLSKVVPYPLPSCFMLFSLPRASDFLVVPPEDCRGNIVGLDRVQEKSMKQEGRGQDTTFESVT